MSNKFNDVEYKALKLPATERALLANHLLSSLEESDIDPEIEKIWAEEAEARYQQYLEGEIESKPSTLVLEKARASLSNGS